MNSKTRKTQCKKTVHQIQKALVTRCLHSTKGIKWAIEIKTAKELFAWINDIEFWDVFCPHYKMNSILHLKTEEGKDMILKEYGLFKMKEPILSPIPIEDNKNFEEKYIEVKPKTTKDFLNVRN